MKQRLMLSMVVSLMLAALFSVNNVAWSFEKLSFGRVTADRNPTPFFLEEEKETAYCEIYNDDGAPYFVIASSDSGFACAVYMDPGTCPGEPAYPFRITDIHFDLYALPYHDTWPVNLRFSIKQVLQGEKCLGPDPVAALYSETFAFPIESSFVNIDNMINFNLSQPFCVYEPFFLEVMYLDHIVGTDSLPGFTMDLEGAEGDSCNDWAMIDGEYYGYYDIWIGDVPGNPIIRVTGYTEAPECADLWYWKPDKPDQEFPAPSGMPDFDQFQFGSGQDSLALCGPTAVANCLWWFNAVPPDTSPPDLIRLLSDYMQCEPDTGTYVDDMEMGLQQYFDKYGCALEVSTFQAPNFFEMADSLKACQDIILLLSFWEWNGEEWEWKGGHFVTMAGVCSESLKIAVSDPARDAAEGEWPGRVRPEHLLHSDNDTLHNDPTYVSQDIYQSTIVIPSPSPVNPFWEINYSEAVMQNFIGMNMPKEFRELARPAPTDAKVGYVTEVEYAVMICPKPTAVGEDGEETLIPRQFDLQQNYPNPFNNETIIKFNLRRPSSVTLTLYNILGQKVRTLLTGRMRAGEQTIRWDGKDQRGNDLSSGIYFYQLKAGEQAETKRLILLK